MNFVFCREKHQLPKYAIGTRPHVINSVKMVSNSVPRGKKPNSTAHTFILNMLVENEFRIAAKKKKTSIVYILLILYKEAMDKQVNQVNL